MKTNYKKPLTLASVCLMTAGFTSISAQAHGLDKALTAGKPTLDMRLRYETVDDGNSSTKDATAVTLRTRLGYMSGDYQGFSAFAEFEDVRVVAGYDDYAPENTAYATVADPEVTQLNQAFIGYRYATNTKLKLGKQRIILDNARHVGNVGWRQNEQTYDAISLVNTSLPNTRISYAYLDKVDGILSKFDKDVSDHLININYSGFGPGKISAYAYLLEDDDDNSLTSDTYGIRFAGNTKLAGNNKLLYTAEFASQSTDTYDATYSLIEGGVKYAGVTAKLGYEVLGSDNGAYGFETRLATKHAFNGWADKFLTTPANGLVDTMLTVTTKVIGVKLLGVYHDYGADEGSADYGTELNLLALKKYSKRYSAGIKYSSYSADTFSTDTDKLWVWGQMKL